MAMDEPPAQMTELDQIKFKMNAVTDEVSCNGQGDMVLNQSDKF